jgi:hypothetical protein
MRRTSLTAARRPGVLWCLGLLPFVVGPAPGGCQKGAKEAPEVRVTVLAILATDQNKRVDPKLQCIARQVQEANERLTGFRPARMSCKSVPLNGVETFDLVGDKQVSVTVLKPADKNNRVQIKIAPPELKEITYTTVCGKFFPLVTPYQTANGETLIIAVRVQPCHKGKEK